MSGIREKIAIVKYGDDEYKVLNSGQGIRLEVKERVMADDISFKTDERFIIPDGTIKVGTYSEVDVSEYAKVDTSGLEPKGTYTFGSSEYVSNRNIKGYATADTTKLKPSGTQKITNYSSQINVLSKQYVDTTGLTPEAINKTITENGVYNAREFNTNSIDYGLRGISQFSIDVVAKIDDMNDYENLNDIDKLIGEDW